MKIRIINKDLFKYTIKYTFPSEKESWVMYMTNKEEEEREQKNGM